MSSFLAKTAVKNSSTKVGASGPSGKRVNRETLTPFDVTHYKGTGRAGQAPLLTYRAEPEEEAFSVHVRTARRDPASFTLGRTGLAGGVAGPAAAAEASSAMAAHKREVAPPLIKPTERRFNPPNTELRRYYERSDIPCRINGSKLAWRVDLSTLDYHHYLPIFVSGLREVEEPFRFIAEEGSMDLIRAGGERKVLPVVPQLILPMKDGFATRDERVVLRSLRVLAALADLGPSVGAALVPFYRQLLPPISVFMDKDVNLGDGIDYGQRFGHTGQQITTSLQKLELNGGPDALVNLKYCLPKYESALLFN